MIKLIASDIDGTLLTNHGQIVFERTADLIRRLIDKGIYFTAASRRQYSNTRPMFDPPMAEYLLCCRKWLPLRTQE
ncbi:MAG: HAD hydrolase family protein [Dorea sp.]